MDKPWYRRWFGQAPPPEMETTRAMADQGDPAAQFALGLRYASEKPASPDFVQAAHWYRLAAAQFHSLAQFNLGVMYSKGQGVPRDEEEAATWFEKAALLGDPGAQFNLGLRYQRASLKGSPAAAPESKIEAYKWYHLAASQGYKDSAAACDTLTLNMTSAEVADGNQRAAAFLTAKPAHA